MSSFKNQPILQPVDTRQREFRLLSQFLFYFDSSKNIPDEPPIINYAVYRAMPAIVVPRGFITDMASVPRFLWWLYSPFGSYGNAAILHDWLYSSELFSRKTCDQIFRHAMQVSGVNVIRRNIIYFAVRMFGWLVWRNHVPAKVQALRQIAEEIHDLV